MIQSGPAVRSWSRKKILIDLTILRSARDLGPAGPLSFSATTLPDATSSPPAHGTRPGTPGRRVPFFDFAFRTPLFPRSRYIFIRVRLARCCMPLPWTGMEEYEYSPDLCPHPPAEHTTHGGVVQAPDWRREWFCRRLPCRWIWRWYL